MRSFSETRSKNTTMATVTSLTQLRGALGDAIFRSQNGKTIAYLASSPDRDSWRKNAQGVRSHENAQEFGGAAMAGSAIYKAICNKETRDIFRPYAHNYIAKRLRRHAPRAAGKRAAHQYTFQGAIPALHRLDLTREGSASHQIRLTPIGPVHRPEALRIQGLRQAADAIGVPENVRLEFRLTRKTLCFPETHYNPADWEWKRTDHQSILIEQLATQWIPIECIQKEGITLSLSPQQSSPDGNELTFLVVEWRKIKSGQRPKPIPGHGMIRLAAIRTTLENAQEMAIQGIQTPARTRRYLKRPKEGVTRRFKHLDPARYLQFALQGMNYPNRT